MGVTHLWPLLKPAGETYSWEDLNGSTLAVDSAIWLMETEQIPGYKPYLKNALSRIMALMRHGVRLVFVLEGQEKELKAATLAKRSSSPVKARRSLFPHASEFSSKIRELQQLLDLLGIPWVQSSGEAEAVCGVLNERGIVDGVISNDSDTFLLGAKKVYRNITGNKAKENEQEVYTMERLQELFGTDRQGLVALALIAGCDYTSGSQGVGSKSALKLLKHWGTQVDSIQRMKQWRNDASLKELEAHVGVKKPPHCRKCKLNTQNGTHKCKRRKIICKCTWHVKEVEVDSHKVELDVRRRALRDPNFPDNKIIDAFLRPKAEDAYDLQWNQPQWSKFMEFCSCLGKDWQEDAGRKKLLPLVTAWITNFSDDSSHSLAEPIKIVKTRLQNRHPMYEVWWKTQGRFPKMLLPSGDQGFLSQENQSVFRKRFPEIVTVFEQEQAVLHKSTPIKKRKSQTTRADQPLITSLLPMCKRMRFTPCNSPKRQQRPSTPPLPQLIDLDNDVQFKTFIEAKN